jgi:hypothetical protein
VNEVEQIEELPVDLEAPLAIEEISAPVENPAAEEAKEEQPEISEELKNYLNERIAEHEKRNQEVWLEQHLNYVRDRVICREQHLKSKTSEVPVEGEDLQIDKDISEKIRTQLISFRHML